MTSPEPTQSDAKLIFPCGLCGAQLRVPQSQAGQTLHCPRCRELIRVPQDPNLAAEIEAATAPPSWFAPILIWFVCSSVGFLSGFIYGFWFRGK